MSNASPDLVEQTALERRAAPLPYQATVQWIAENSQTDDARQLARLLMALSTSQWSYPLAFDTTQHLSAVPSTLALQMIGQYPTAGPCAELLQGSNKTQLMLPDLARVFEHDGF